MRRMVICCAATVALLGLIVLAVSPRKTPEGTVAATPGEDSPESKVDRLPDDLGSLMALGLAQRQAGDYGCAEVSLRKFLELSPGRSARRERIQLELSLALLKQSRPREALEELVKLLLENPYARRAYVQLGQCLSRLGHPGAADGLFEVARTLSRGDAESGRAADFIAAERPVLAARYKARSFALSGQFGEAERVLREATAIGSPGAQIYLVEYLMDTLQVHEARKILDGLALSLGRSHPDVRGWMAMALKREGRAEEAAAILSDLCREIPRLVAVWAPELARILLEDLARPAEALEWLELYVEDHENVEARILLARALFGVDESEEAVEVLEATASGGYAWEKGAGDLWLALGRVRLGQDLRKANDFLATVADRQYMPQYHLALAELRIDGADSADWVVDPREDARRLAILRAESRALRARAARAEGPEVASHLCSAAEVSWKMEDRERAIRLARIAASVEPRAPRAWTLLKRWHQRPEEVFFRAEARKKLAELGEFRASTSALEEIVESLTGQE